MDNLHEQHHDDVAEEASSAGLPASTAALILPGSTVSPATSTVSSIASATPTRDSVHSAEGTSVQGLQEHLLGAMGGAPPNVPRLLPGTSGPNCDVTTEMVSDADLEQYSKEDIHKLMAQAEAEYDDIQLEIAMTLSAIEEQKARQRELKASEPILRRQQAEELMALELELVKWGSIIDHYGLPFDD